MNKHNKTTTCCIGFFLTTNFIGTVYAQPPQEDLIRGYVHTAEKSRFFSNEDTANMRAVEENGFAKYRGKNGILAMDKQSGLTIAIRSMGQDKTAGAGATSSEPRSLLDHRKHNDMVKDYFIQAGLPRDQIGDLHANTYLSAHGARSKAVSVRPRVDGYATILARKVGDFAVVDSVAWARMDDKGRVFSEWVYWPSIPSKVVDDARRLHDRINSPEGRAFLSKLPSAQKTGRVVIRHSSPFANGVFAAFASYDVVEKTESPGKKSTSVYTRHFDIEGREIRLPQEKRNRGQDYPPKDSARP